MKLVLDIDNRQHMIADSIKVYQVCHPTTHLTDVGNYIPIISIEGVTGMRDYAVELHYLADVESEQI